MSESAPKWVGRWAGGRIKEARGRRLWVIERQVQGVRRAVVLGVNSERDALAELARFERDPTDFRTRRQDAAADPGEVRIDSETLEAFLEHAKKQGLTADYRKHILGRYLTE